MVAKQPHFLLFSEAQEATDSPSEGRWHFLLESLQGETVVEAADDEPGMQGERLELLAVIRGLEALEQPSRVTLVTSSRQVSRGFRFGISEWRNNNWQWERYGRRVPVKNSDLWKRIDQALKFHRVECRTWRIDSAHATQENSAVLSGEQADVTVSQRVRLLAKFVTRGARALMQGAPAADRGMQSAS
ncbi:MAG: hypothetical protein P8N76_09650 [Pirellulaceae bacterium]|nr:hypothetical protein [Pirellulaceae bacterium]